MRLAIDCAICVIESFALAFVISRYYMRRHEARGYERGLREGVTKGGEAGAVAFQEIMNEQVLPLLLRLGAKPADIAEAMGSRIIVRGCNRPGCKRCAARKAHVH